MTVFDVCMLYALQILCLKYSVETNPPSWLSVLLVSVVVVVVVVVVVTELLCYYFLPFFVFW